MERIETNQARILAALNAQGGIAMTLDELKAQVEANVSVEGSALTLIQGMAAKLTELAAELAAAGQDTTKLDAMAQELNTSAAALSAAVSANTPTP